MSDQADPYWKLPPPLPTPTDEICSCSGFPPVVLQAHFSPNPISCLSCNLEVPPERIGFSSAIAERLAHWQSFHDCFYLLWLDSAEFESWGKRQLEDPSSPVNTRAVDLVAELNQFRRAYYWWFQDEGIDPSPAQSTCPRCGAALVQAHGRWLCEACSIVVAN